MKLWQPLSLGTGSGDTWGCPRCRCCSFIRPNHPPSWFGGRDIMRCRDCGKWLFYRPGMTWSTLISSDETWAQIRKLMDA